MRLYIPGLSLDSLGESREITTRFPLFSRFRLSHESWGMRLNISGLSLDSLGESKKTYNKIPFV
jgi:hypothetical protein